MGANTYNDDNNGGGDRLMSLAKSAATKGHPNHTLIQHILTKAQICMLTYRYV